MREELIVRQIDENMWSVIGIVLMSSVILHGNGK